MRLTFVAAVLDGLVNEVDDWRAWLSRELEERGVRLCEDGEIRCGDRNQGPYELLGVAEAKAALGDRPWFSLEAPSPELGEPIGFLTWSQMGDEDLALDQLIPALMRRARGFIARRDTNEVRYPVTRRRLSLAHLVDRHGFEDGDMLLDRSEEALGRVAIEAEKALLAAGLEGHVGVFGSHHNPVRLSGHLRRGGVVIAEEDERAVLESVHFEICAYDWAILRDQLFWLE